MSMPSFVRIKNRQTALSGGSCECPRYFKVLSDSMVFLVGVVGIAYLLFFFSISYEKHFFIALVLHVFAFSFPRVRAAVPFSVGMKNDYVDAVLSAEERAKYCENPVAFIEKLAVKTTSVRWSFRCTIGDGIQNLYFFVSRRRQRRIYRLFTRKPKCAKCPTLPKCAIIVAPRYHK